MRKFLLIICAALTAVNAFAYDFESNGICYNIKNNQAEVTYQVFMKPANYAGLTDAVIPATVTYNGKTYNVTSIGNLAFAKSSIKSISIPSTMTEINTSAFTGCEIESLTLNTSNVGTVFNDMTSIKNLIVSNQVTNDFAPDAFDGTAFETINYNTNHLNTYSFMGNKSLKSLVIGNSVTVIGDIHSWYGMFQNCSNLTSITFGSSVQEICNSAFSGCGITELNLPEGVSTLGTQAFSSCKNLTEVTIPSTVSFGYSYIVFEKCPIEVLHINSNHFEPYTLYGGNNLYSCDWFWKNSSLRVVYIGSNVTKISAGMFYGCTNLETVIVPASVTAMGGDETDGYGFSALKPFGHTNATIVFAGSSIPSGWKDNYKPATVVLNTVLSNGLAFTITNTSTHTVEVAKFTADIVNRSGATNVEIPSTVKINGTNYTVTGIGQDAFRGCNKLQSVTIPNTIKTIGKYAFSGCTLLSGLTLPNGLTTIGQQAFSSCSSLREITIPSSVTTVGNNAFGGCYALETLTINSSKIGTAFSELDQLRNLTIGSTITSTLTNSNFKDCQIENLTINNSNIGTAFSNKTSLRTITFGSNVTSIPANAFSGCTGLETVEIPSSITSIGSNAFLNVRNIKYSGNATGSPWGALNYNATPDADGFVYSNSEKTILKGYFGTNRDVVIPYGVTTIADRAFSHCAEMTSITIPASVRSIGNYAFEECTSLTKAEFASIKSLCGISFGNTKGNPLYYAHHLYVGGEEVTELVIPSDISSINDATFCYCSYLTAVTIPGNIGSIGIYAFFGCSGLSSLTLSNGIVNIGAYAFGNCSSLETLTIPNSVNYINSYAFKNCSNLNTLNILSATLTARLDAFRDCNALTVATIATLGDLQFESRVFFGCANAKLYFARSKMEDWSEWYDGSENNIKWEGYFYVKDGIAYTIDYENHTAEVAKSTTFLSNLNITDVDIPNTLNINGTDYAVTSIAVAAFSSCDNLISVNIGNNVKTIGEAAFQKCSKLESVTIGNSVETIERSAFEKCTSLSSITIPNSVTTLGIRIFQECTSLKNATLSNGLTTIDGNTFYKCSNLESVVIPNSITTIKPQAFYNCSSLSMLTIPANITSIGNNAFYNVISIKNPTSYTTGSPWGAKSVYVKEVIYGDFIYGDDARTILIGYKGNGGIIRIPNTVKTISNYAFRGCNNAGIVIVPNTVTSIEDYAFSKVRHIVYDGNLVDANANWGAYYKNKPYDSNGFIFEDEAHTKLIMYGGNATDITTPSTVQTINKYAFLECNNLISVALNDGVTSIADGVFYDCKNLKTVTLPNTLESIGENAFKNCSSLTTITIPNSVTTLGSCAFENCSNLTSVTLSNQLTEIKSYTFRYCRSLQSIIIPNSVTSIGGNAFNSCYSLKSIDIPSSVESIGGYAFSNCGLNSVTFTKGLKTIGYDAFTRCVGLTSVSIPNSVTTIEASAFRSCKRMISATIPNSVTTINALAFSNNPNLTIYCACAENDKPAGWVENWSENIKEVKWGYWYVDAIPDDYSHGTVAGAGTYGDGEKATLTAIAAAGYTFTNWSNGIDWTPYKMSVTNNATITANFAINTYKFLTGGANGEVAVTGTANSDSTYNHGRQIRLTATADEHYHFVRWSNGVTANPYTFSIASDSVITAVFEGDAFPVSSTASNGTVNGAGSYAYGSEATLTATPAANYHFARWSNGVKANPYTLNVTKDTTVNPVFAINTFNAMAATEADGTVSAGRAIVAYGDTTKFTATPIANYHLARWSDGSTANPYIVTITSDTLLIAEFEINRYNITVNANNGTVTGAGSYTHGATATLTATAARGYTFKGWSTGSKESSITITVEADMVITANFVANKYTVSFGNVANGTLSGDGEYDFGTEITLKADADEGFSFSKWSDGNTDNPRKVTVEDNMSLTATFVPKTYSLTLNADHGSITGAADSYQLGSKVVLTAVPDEGYHFTKWGDGNTDNPRTIIVDAELLMKIKDAEWSYTAIFEADGQNTAVVDEAATAVSVSTRRNTIVVENADAEIRIYDAMGRLVDRDVDNRIHAEFIISTEGVYIVRVGDTVKRVMIKM